MAKLPQTIIDAWADRNGPVVLATIDGDQTPNIIYATCVSLYDNEYIIVADNYFDKTRRNILSGSKGAALFITSDNKAYQLKGTFEYHKDGPVFDEMKSWNPAEHPGHAAAALKVEEVYSGADKLL
jgi:hypothetical protein